MNKTVFITILLLLSSFAYGQVTPGPASATLVSPAPSAAATPVPSATATPAPLDLFLQTLPLDIQSANYYELVTWCQRLGIDDAGDRKTLQQKLFTHYQIATPAPTPMRTGTVTEKKINILSADLSRYFSLAKDDTKENYIQLDGGVSVTVREDKFVHAIRAERIVVNQEMKLLIAEGDVEYTKTAVTGTQKPEIYRGDNLSFNLKTLDGIFYNGISETQKKIGEKNLELKFLFSGKKIIKLENDNIIIDDAVITSSQSLTDPNWKIAAKRIWILAPEEWAAKDALLYIGEIPFLYLPYFFNPGDELFFNPVLGYREREGNYIQTTTYLVGEKPADKKNNTFSIINIAGDETKKYKLERVGLFLKKTGTEQAAPPAPTGKQSDYLKVMFDIYSRLGFYGGVDLNFAEYGKFMGGVGISRTIVRDPVGLYTIYIPDENGNAVVTDLNYTMLAGIFLPLRYGFEGTFKLPPLWKLMINGMLESYSDPVFPSDFFNRSENTDLIQLLDPTKQEQGVNALQKNNLTWFVNSTLDFTNQVLAPYINLLKISKLYTELSWRNKTADNSAASPYFNFDPGNKFFYPDKLILPNVQAEISGSLLRLPILPKAQNKTETKKTEPDSGKGFRSLFPVNQATTPGTEKPKEQVQRDALKAPLAKTDRKGITDLPTESTLSIDYQFRPNVQMDNIFNDTEWNKITDIDYALDYSTLAWLVPVALNYNNSLWGSLFLITDNLRMDWKKRSSFLSPDADPLTENNWQNTLTEDYRGLSLTVGNNFSLTFKPLIGVNEFQNSQVNYVLNWMVYNYKFDKLDTNNIPLYNEEVFDWNETTVTSHNLNSSLVYSPGNKPAKLALNFQLPPLAPPLEYRATSSLEFYIWEFSNSLNTSFKKETDVASWVFEPLAFQSVLNLSNWISFSEKLTYDLNELEFRNSATSAKLFKIGNQFLLEQEFSYLFQDKAIEKYNTVLNFYDLKLSLTMNRQAPLYYDDVILNWTTNNPATPEVDPADPVFMPADLSAVYNLKLDPVYSWKNRIAFSSNITTNFRLDFNKVSESKFAIDTKLNFSIYKFLEFQFAASSYNNRLYEYFPYLYDKVKSGGASLKNIFLDLLYSFDVFNDAHLLQTNFKLRNLSLKLVHHLEDWDISVDLTGSYQKDPNGSDMIWTPLLSIIVQWIPIPELKKAIKSDNNGWDING